MTPTPVPSASVTLTSTSTPTPTPTSTPTSTPTATPSASATATTGPAESVVIAVGDIACNPTWGINSTHCQQMATSNVTLAANPSAVLVLGDNQYDCGLASDFAAAYDPSWGRLRGITYPVIGNHEYNVASGGAACTGSPSPSDAGGYWGYFGDAATPLQPGCRSNCQGWYSFDLGSWHVIVLNSMCAQVGGCGAGSPEELWLKADLAAHSNTCTVALYHHPRYSSGNAGNNSIMQTFWQDLYNGGADLVLNGHDHDYERFAPMDGSGNADPAYGLREMVIGTGGRDLLTMGAAKPNSLVRQNTSFGVVQFTFSANGYSWQFLPAAGGSFADSGSATCHGKPGSGQTSTAVSISGTFGVSSGAAGQLSGGLALLGLVAPSIDRRSRRSRRPSRLAKRVIAKRPGLLRHTARPIRRRLARRWPHPVTRR